MSWTWRLENADGTDRGSVVTTVVPSHSTQSDAETWLGENWHELAAQGVVQVSLLCDSKLSYGPMPLSE
jgi:uncharacterized protein YgiM (DUF1202 family)